MTKTITAITMVIRQFEVTVSDPITRAEFEWFECETTRYAWDCAMTPNGRILMVEGPDDIHELIGVLAEHEFVHDIALIKEVATYEPQYEDNDMHYTIDLES